MSGYLALFKGLFLRATHNFCVLKIPVKTYFSNLIAHIQMEIRTYIQNKNGICACAFLQIT